MIFANFLLLVRATRAGTHIILKLAIRTRSVYLFDA